MFRAKPWISFVIMTGAAAAPHEISFLHRESPTGVEVEAGFAGRPDAHGVLRQYLVRAPRFRVATYVAAFQKYNAEGRRKDAWPDGANRFQPLAIHDFRDLNSGGVYLLMERESGGYLALLPLTGPNTAAWFSSAGGDLALNVGTLGTGEVRGDLPLVAWAESADPYDAARQVWETALAHPLIGHSARMREEKSYPEILRYLGWCSWEEYHHDISESVLTGAVDGIDASGLPVRWLLVDDGHLDISAVPGRPTGQQLLSFQPDPKKLPNGWGPLLQRRRGDGIRWIGVWLNFNGYWKGVAANNRLPGLAGDLAPVPGAGSGSAAVLQPKPGMEHSLAFYNAMLRAYREAGFDFVKVDNQAHNLAWYRGTEQPVATAAANSRALEMTAAFQMDALINCMAHGPVTLFNTRISNVTRSSEDYSLGNLPRAKRHLHNSYANLVWLGQTVWGDHDMFHSDDPVAGEIMAVSKALSGGPVYLSDNPRKFAIERIRPLCFRDGELLRPLAPAVSLPESIFVDPFSEARPYRVIAPLANRSAAIVVYNLTDPEKAVTGFVSPSDYAAANGMMQPRGTEWRVPEEGLLLYDWAAKEAVALRGRHTFPLPAFGGRLFLLCPIRRGWSVIGATGKYLAPAGVEVLSETGTELLLRVRESGPVAIWQRESAAVLKSPDCPVRRLADHLWQADAGGDRNALVRIDRVGR